MIYYSYISTAIGKILLIANGDRLIGLYHVQQSNCPTIHNHWQCKEDLTVFIHTKIQLHSYLCSKITEFEIDYIITGTPFQKEIWQHLRKIPYGRVITYKTFAALTAYPKATRIVACTLASNPLLIVLPCHRIIHSNGTLGGYAAGTTIKQVLLQLEQKTLDHLIGTL